MFVKSYKATKYTCYYTYLSISTIFCLPPMLFLTFREMYGITYTLLGTLVLTNFVTQLSVDLIFTFFSRYFKIKAVIRIMPLLTALGLFVYALIPTFFPQIAYTGLLIGTVIFSIAAGLHEVFLSPTIAALPSENPERDMSLLHSVYAYGFLAIVLISSAFIHFFGAQNWMILACLLALLPIGSFILYCIVPLPDINLEHAPETGERKKKKRFGLALCAACIFLGSCAENAMTNWISSYLESALHIPKAVGDILGLAVFAVLLGLGRSIYAKYGKHISRVLLLGMIGSAACYLIASLSSIPILSMLACIFTGFCTSMLWPGTLIFMEEQFPSPGVTAYALMAAGGDFGASIAPQMLGVVVDNVAASKWAQQLGKSLSLTTEQIGMKAGMLTAAIFPILGIALLIYMRSYFKKQNRS